MTRRAARVDNNQAEIVQALRQMGYSVLLLHMVGKGCPDILIGKHGVNLLVELKDPIKYRRDGHDLTPDEAVFHEEWQGMAIIACSVEQIDLAFIGLLIPG